MLKRIRQIMRFHELILLCKEEKLWVNFKSFKCKPISCKWSLSATPENMFSGGGQRDQ